MFQSHRRAQRLEARLVRDQIETRCSTPQTGELSVVDKDARRIRRIRAVFQVVAAAIEQQCGAICIEEDGRIRVVLSINDELAGRRVLQRLRQRTRRKIWIEYHERAAAGMTEQYHHGGGGKKREALFEQPSARSADRERKCREHKWRTQISKRT